MEGQNQAAESSPSSRSWRYVEVNTCSAHGAPTTDGDNQATKRLTTPGGAGLGTALQSASRVPGRPSPHAPAAAHLALALLAEPCCGGLGHWVGKHVPSRLGLALPRPHKVIGIVQLAHGQWQLQQAGSCMQREGSSAKASRIAARQLASTCSPSPHLAAYVLRFPQAPVAFHLLLFYACSIR